MRRGVLVAFTDDADLTERSFDLAQLLDGQLDFSGAYILFQTLGFAHPAYTPGIKTAARVISLLFFVGYCSIPAAVLTGVVHL